MRHGGRCCHHHGHGAMGVAGPHWGHGTWTTAMADLGLEHEQRARVRAILYETLEETIPKKAQVRVGMLQLARQAHAEDPSLSEVEKTLEDISKTRLELAKLWARHWMKVREVLTPEQRRELLEMGWHHGLRGGGGRGWSAWHRGGPGPMGGGRHHPHHRHHPPHS